MKIVILVGLSILAVGAIGAAIKFRKDKLGLVLLILMIIGAAATSFGFLALGKQDGYLTLQNELTKEVDLNKVPIKGYHSSNAKITIVYKDGEIEKVFLVKGTTVEATKKYQPGE
ncbi:MAG: hypothetical protein NT136_00190 [Candidatus Moranbacteria bacterium]|nr:hypothetical protein [Candidatus Moranbacteria bacterium]